MDPTAVVLPADRALSEGEARESLLHAPVLAVLRVTQVEQEPSGLGGEYVAFEVVEVVRGAARPTRAGWGAHGQTLTTAVGDYYVAALEPLGGLRTWRGDPRWAIRALPSIDARAYGLVRASSQEDAEQKAAHATPPP